MGCDIHFHVEKKTEQGWVRAEPLVKNPYFGQFDDEPEFKHERLYGGRNYALFAMLANVRNEGGIRDAGERIAPISMPRGLPEDVSVELRKDSDEWGADGHSHSWLTLAELLAVPWHESTINHVGYVTPSVFHQFDAWGQSPTSWCGGVSSTIVSNDEMRQLIADRVIDPLRSDAPRSHYTQIRWTVSWLDAAPDFPQTLVRMAGIASFEGLGMDDVRAVFWFDN